LHELRLGAVEKVRARKGSFSFAYEYLKKIGKEALVKWYFMKKMQ